MKKLLGWLVSWIILLSTVSAQMIATDQQNLNQSSVAQATTPQSVSNNTWSSKTRDITNELPVSNIVNNNYLTIPLSRSWLEKNKISYQINEWWMYSSGEKAIHWLTNHKSIDYTVPYGTPVYAPVDGFIQGSYYNTTLWAIGSRVMYQDRTINYGLWYRVQIVYPDPRDPFDPSKVTFIQLAHLSRLSPIVEQTIKGSDYIYDPVEDAMKIDNYSLTYTDLAFVLRAMSTRVIPVKQWELIWYAGNSGLEHWENVDENYIPRDYVFDPQNSRDDVHIHMQTYKRNSNGSKISTSIKDPYHLGTWATGPNYPTHDNWWALTPWHVFKTMDGRLLDYAK